MAVIEAIEKCNFDILHDMLFVCDSWCQIPCGFLFSFLDSLVISVTDNRYYRMCEAAQVGLGKNASVHSIHGSLLAVGELLRY